MPNPIPLESHVLVRRRDLDQCVRCGGRGGQWHHRRRRNVSDEHQHCTCNGILLCGTCHRWVHAHPFEAKAGGFIVSAHQKEPGIVPVQATVGAILLDCQGRYVWTSAQAGVPTV